MKSIERNFNPSFYEVVCCEEDFCESVEDLQVNRFNHRVICTSCLNAILAEQAIEDDYRDKTENQLYEERNA